MLIEKNEFGAHWFLIFHHNVTKGGYFLKKEEAQYSRNPNRFSLLAKINDLFKINDNFEFLLLYPNLEGYLHWTQKTNPMETKSTTPDTYKIVKNSWSSSSEHFEGLGVSSGATLLKGTPNSENWFYAVGQYREEASYPGKIPGPLWKFQDNYFYEVNLYIKIVDLKLVQYLYPNLTPRTQMLFLKQHIMILFLIPY